MEEYKIVDISKKEVWEKFLLSKSPKSFLQSWNWGETNALCGSEIFRFGIFKKNKIVGIFQILHEKAKRGPHFLIPGGPIIDWKDKRAVEKFLDFVRKFAIEKGVWFIRIRPEILDDNETRTYFKKLGFVPAPMHLNAENTWVLDITKSEEELLKNMRKTTRYLIKKSNDPDFAFEKTINLSASNILSDLQVDTSKRHKFVGFSKKLFEAQLATFGKDGQCEMYIGKYKKKVYCAAIIIYYGDTAYYHHSGSNDESKNIPIAHFLQWNIIKEAKKRGLSYYNFWGVAPSNNPKHRFYGVTIFKKGFGGFQVDYLHAQDLPILPFYYLTYIFESIRKYVRHL
jgi:lipid II:glycine glycyltransferase (peptidoglycan interpeptide bridge formation enzyme)